MGYQDRLARIRAEEEQAKAQRTYLEAENPADVLRDKTFLRDLADFYHERDGRAFETDEDLLDYWYRDQNFRELNSVAGVANAVQASGMSPEQKARFARIKTAYEQQPSFWREGGRGWDAVPDIALAIATDPLNAIPGVGAATSAAKLALRGAARPAVGAVARAAGADAALNAAAGAVQDVAEQRINQEVGLQDEFSTRQLLGSTALSAAAGAAAGGALAIPGARRGARLGRQARGAVQEGNDALFEATARELRQVTGRDLPQVQAARRAFAEQDAAAAAAQPTVEPPGWLPEVKRPEDQLIETYENTRIDLEERLAGAAAPEDKAIIQQHIDELDRQQEVLRTLIDTQIARDTAIQAERKAVAEGDEVAARAARTEAIALGRQIRQIVRGRENYSLPELENLVAERAATSAEVAGEAAAEEVGRAAGREAAEAVTQAPAEPTEPATPTPAAQATPAGQTPAAQATPAGQDQAERPAPATQAGAAQETPAEPLVEPAAAESAPEIRIGDFAQRLGITRRRAREMLRELGHQDARTAAARQDMGRIVGETEEKDRAILRVQEILDTPEVAALKDALGAERQAEVIRYIIDSSEDLSENARTIARSLVDQLAGRGAEMTPKLTDFQRAAAKIIEPWLEGLPDDLRIRGREVAERIARDIEQNFLASQLSGPRRAEMLVRRLNEAAEALNRRAIADERGRMSADTPLARSGVETTAGKTITSEVDPATGEVKYRERTQGILKSSGEHGILGRMPVTGSVGAAMARAQILARNGETPIVGFTTQTRVKAVDGVIKPGETGYTDGRRIYARAENMPGMGSAAAVPEAAPVVSRPSVLRLRRRFTAGSTELEERTPLKEARAASDEDGYVREFVVSGKEAGTRAADGGALREGMTAFYDPQSGAIYQDIASIPLRGEEPPVRRDLEEVRETFEREGPESIARKISSAIKERPAETGTAPTTTTAPASEIPAGRMPALRRKKDGMVRVLSERQIAEGKTLDDYYRTLKGASKDEWERGFADAGTSNRQAAARDSFALPGEEPRPQPATTEAAGEAGARAPAPKWDAIKNHTVEVDGKATTLAEVLDEASRLEFSPWPNSLDEHKRIVDRLTQLSQVLPEHIQFPTATRREAVAQLEAIFEGADRETLVAAYDLFRRLGGDPDVKPRVERDPEQAALGAVRRPSDNRIILGARSADVPEIHVLTHELFHWAYMNVLTPADRLDFWNKMTRFYDDTGNLNRRAIADAVPAALRSRVGNAEATPQEMFANLGAAWAAGKTQFPDSDKLWGKMAKIIRSLMDLWRGRGHDIRAELEPYFQKIIPDDDAAARWYHKDYGSLDHLPPAKRKNAEKTLGRIRVAQTHGETLEDALNSFDPDRIDNALSEAAHWLISTARSSGWMIQNRAGVRTSTERMADGRRSPTAAVVLRRMYANYRAIREFRREEGGAESAEALAGLSPDEWLKKVEEMGLVDEAIDTPDSLADEFEEYGFSVIDPDRMAASASGGGERELALVELANKTVDTIRDFIGEMESIYKRQTGLKPFPGGALAAKDNPISARYRGRGAAARAQKEGAAAAEKKAELKAQREQARATAIAQEVAAAPKPAETPTVTGKTDAPQTRPIQEVIRDLIREGGETKRGQQLAMEVLDRAKARPVEARAQVPEDVQALDDTQLKSAIADALRANDRARTEQIITEWQARQAGVDEGILDLFESRVGQAVNREIADNDGLTDEIGIPAKAPEWVKEALRHISHRDAEVSHTARTMLYRMLNLMGKTLRGGAENAQFLTVEDVYRLIGKEPPAGAKAVFADFSDPAFAELRGKVRRMAIGLTRGASDPMDVMHEIAHMASRIMFHDSADDIVAAFNSADDAIKREITARYGDKPQYIQAEEWFAEGAAQYFAERVAKGDIFKLRMEGVEAVALRGRLDRAVDQLREAIAYIVNRMIGRNDVRQMFRQMTWYGDLFQKARRSDVDAAALTRLLENGVPFWMARDTIKTALRKMKAEQRRLIEGYSTTFDENGNLRWWWHATPAGGWVDNPNAVVKLTERGKGIRGWGFYVTSSHEIGSDVYANRPTDSAIERMLENVPEDEWLHASDVLFGLREARMNWAKIKKMLVYPDDRAGNPLLEVLTKKELKKVLKDTEAHIEELSKEAAKYGFDPRVIPLAVHSPRPFDFSDGREYFIDEQFGMDEEVVELLDALDEKGLLVVDNVVMALQERADALASMGFEPHFSGNDLHEILTQEISFYTASMDYREAADAINDVLQELGYTGLIATDFNTPDLAREQIGHEIMVLFHPGQVKHLLEATRFDPDDEILRHSEVGAPLMPNGAILQAAMRTSGELNPNRISPVLQAMDAAGAPPRTLRLMRKIARKETDETSLKTAAKFTAPLQLKSNSRRLREVSGARWIADFIAPEQGASIFERHYSEVAKIAHPLIKAAHSLPDAGNALTNHLRKVSDLARAPLGFETMTPPSHKRIVSALRRGDDAIDRLDPSEANVARQFREMFRDMHARLDGAGVIIGKVGDYFPQKWNPERLRRDGDKFVGRLAQYFIEESRADPVRRELSLREAHEAARKVHLKLIDEDGAAVTHKAQGRRGTPFDSDMQRMIRLSPDQLDRLGLEEFMENDLLSVTAHYLDGAVRRILFTEKLGWNNHGWYDYLEVALHGPTAAKKLLSSPKVAKVSRKYVTDQGSEEDRIEIPLMAAMPPNVADDAINAAMRIIANGGDANAALAAIMRTKPDGGATFRKRAEAIANALHDFNGTQGISARELDFANHTFRAVQNKRVYDGYAADPAYMTSRMLRNFSSVTLLGWTLLTSMTDTIMPAIRSGRPGAQVKAIAKYMSDPDYRDMVRNIGVSMENFIHDRHASLYGASGGRVSNAFFNLTMLTPWTTMQREIAGIHGYEALKAMVNKAQRHYRPGETAQNRHFRTAKRFLDHYGLGDYATNPSKSIDDPHAVAADDRVRQAILKFTNESIFSPSHDDIPVWGQTPIGMLVSQLKTFPLMAGRLSKYVLDEAFGREVLEDGRKVWKANPAPLMTMLALGSGFGAGTLALKDISQWRGGEDNRDPELRERRLSQILEQFGIEAKPGKVNVMGVDVDVDVFLGWYVEGFLLLGGLGALAELLYNTAATLDNGTWGAQRMASYVFGPTVSTGMDAFNFLAGVQEMAFGDGESNSKARTGVRAAVGRVPILGGVGAFREGVTDAIAGEAGQRGGPKSGFEGGFSGGFSGGFGEGGF